MKNKILYFCRTYLFSILYGVFIVLCLKYVSIHYKDVIWGGDNYTMTVKDIFLICGWPILSAVHGIISGIFYKKIWFQSLFLFFSGWLSFVLVYYKNTNGFNQIFEISYLFWAFVTVVFSLVLFLITRFVIKIVKDFIKRFTDNERIKKK